MSLSAVPLPLLRLPAGLPIPAPSTARPEPAGAPPLLARIAAEVRLDDAGFSLGGRHSAVTARRWAERSAALTAALEEALYRRYVQHRRTTAADPEDAAFVQRVRAAVGERFFWEDGWQPVGSAPDGRLLVEHDDLVLHVEPVEVRPGRRGLEIRFPADLPAAEAGRWTIVGVAGPARHTAGGLAECYLHVLPDTAPLVLAALVAELDALGLPFTASVLTDGAAGGSPDSVVVRTGREHLPALARVAVRCRRRAPARFGEAVPAFARPLGPGVAVADAPAPGVGTARHRCRVLAAALVTAGPDADACTRLVAMQDALAAAGLDAFALHLNPGSAEVDLREE